MRVSLCGGMSFVAAVMAVLPAICPIARAQTLYGSLTGNVTDNSGASVPKATIEILNTATGFKTQATSDDNGAYLASNLQPGSYRVTISATSFQTRIQEGVQLEVNTVRRLDAALQLSTISETVTVGASEATLQTDRADVNNQLSSNQLTDLPLINSQGRNFQALLKVLPGFTPPAEAHSDAGNPQRSMVTQVERHAAVEQQYQARWRNHQLSVAAPAGRVSAAGRGDRIRQRCQQQL